VRRVDVTSRGVLTGEVNLLLYAFGMRMAACTGTSWR